MKKLILIILALGILNINKNIFSSHQITPTQPTDATEIFRKTFPTIWLIILSQLNNQHIRNYPILAYIIILVTGAYLQQTLNLFTQQDYNDTTTWGLS